MESKEIQKKPNEMEIGKSVEEFDCKYRQTKKKEDWLV